MKTLATTVCLLLAAATAAAADPFEPKKGDHVCLIGNTLADRMQHHGWLETLLVSRFADRDLVFRNLGFSGDEITTRLRSDNFGSPDQWLTKCEADVVFAFFGYNESFAGEAGLAKFKQELDAWIKHTLGQKYNGESAPRLVLFSPIAHEDTGDRNLINPDADNARLKLYTAAMAEIAAANNVPLIDLFTPTAEGYASDAKPWTFNGIHLSEYGDQRLAPIIERALTPSGPLFKRDAAALERLRAAINEKNLQWHARYRTVDGYNVYGGRSQEQYESGVGGPKIKNFVVMQQEMTQRDVLTANRDKRVWAVAQGGDLTVDDSNLPQVTAVGPNRENLAPYANGEQAILMMTVAKGCKVNLFASEEEFPELVNPVQMAWDTKGRLWVAAWPSYPEMRPTDEVSDKLLVFEDTNGDGKADTCTPFLDDLNCPTGFQFFKDGVLVMQAPNLWFVRDTDGDGRGDSKELVLMGIDSADSHHTTNAMVLDPGGATYLSDGVFHRTQIETPWGPPVRNNDGCIFRYEPLTQKIERYVSYGFANPHGRVFDRWGTDIITDATGNANYFAPAFSGFVEYPGKHAGMREFWNRPSRPCPGTGMVSSRHFPEDWQGNFLNCNVIGFQGIFRVKVTEDGSGLKGETLEDLVKSTDPNFRPTAVSCAPDGSIYFLDWQQQLIGHLQHHIRDPNRDKSHGRIYRITYEGRPLLTPPKIDGQPIEALLELLESPENDVRTRAKIELGKHDADKVVAATKRWSVGLDKSDAEYEHHMLEALWVHQWHNVVDEALLQRMLASKDHRARAAAAHVLCYWRDRVPAALEIFKQLAADPHPRVRLEAVRAASFYTVPEAVEVPLIAAEQSGDYYLEYCNSETMRALEPYWKAAVAENRLVNVTSPAGVRFFLGKMSLEQLLKLDRSRLVYLELLYRPEIRDELRLEAIRGIAKDDKKTELVVLLDAIRAIDNQQQTSDQSVVFDLMRILAGRGAGELAAARGELEKLAQSAKQSTIRQIAYLAMVSVDGKADAAWALAGKSAGSLRDFLTAVPLVSDPGLRASLYDRIEPLLTALPENLGGANAAKGTYGRFVRVELPRRGTLTLAEVEVMSEGQNVARRGKATQKNTAHGGEASRGIDGNKNTSYGGGGQTHTDENTPDPWWEVDLGEEVPIDAIIIYNRADGLSSRLKGYTLRVLDASRNDVFRKDDNPAPETTATIEIGGGGPAALVRRAAMNALVSVRGQEARTFESLAKFVIGDDDRLAAIRAIQRLPQSTWPKEQAQPVLDSLVVYITKFPVADRTSPAALDALQLADALTSLVPADQAKGYRAQLRELGVRVIRLGTLPERMSYDQEVLVVQAGKPVEFLLENTDLMPHNFVITQPGALEEIGQLAEASAQQPEFARRQYVPQSPKVLLASVLLQPRQTQKLSFVAPTEPGVYPYVCTYPGHYRRMHGALYVVPDLDAYLEKPEEYLAAANVVPIDPLLKDRRPRTEWKLEDLTAAVSGIEGRNYAAAKQMFQVASCVACHKLDGVGNAFGPDLSQLDPKLQPLDLVKEMLDPSAKINEKFQTQVFQLESGMIVTGLVVEETPTVIKLVENPLAKATITEIKVAEIENRKKSPVSIMPKGLLDKLTRDEILDLVAYIAARGKKDHALFQAGAHAHHHGH
jgi:putative heme-binding domain-containing protein